VSGQIDARRARGSGLWIARRNRHDARIGGEKPTERAMHYGQSAVQGELAEYRLSLRLKTIDVRRVRIVQLETEGRKCRIAHGDLEIFVIVIEGIDLRAQMSIEGAVLPAHFVVRLLLRAKRLRRP